MYQHGTAIIVAVPVPPTSGHQDIRSIGTAPVRSTSLWWWNLWDGIPPLDLWDGIPPAISSRRVTAALGRPQKFHRKVPGPGGRSQWDPSRNPQMMGVAQRGRLKI
jgi:hypothetical protein